MSKERTAINTVPHHPKSLSVASVPLNSPLSHRLQPQPSQKQIPNSGTALSVPARRYCRERSTNLLPGPRSGAGTSNRLSSPPHPPENAAPEMDGRKLPPAACAECLDGVILRGSIRCGRTLRRRQLDLSEPGLQVWKPPLQPSERFAMDTIVAVAGEQGEDLRRCRGDVILFAGLGMLPRGLLAVGFFTEWLRK